MGDLASLDLRRLGGEARLRAVLEDLVQYYVGVYPQHPLALAIWFEKSPDRPEQNLLTLFSGKMKDVINKTPRESLRWKTGVDEPPFVEVHSTSVEYFTQELRIRPESLVRYHDHAEVLYFDKKFLTDEITQFFKIITAPSGLIRGWYISKDLYDQSMKGEFSLRSRMQGRPEIAILKTDESPDFSYAKGIPHIELDQRWLPLSTSALGTYTWYNDLQSQRPGYLLLEGGSLYQILKFEVKTAPEFSQRVLEKLPDDRYPEVYLRAMLPIEHLAA
ncbi:MAG: hypothetical protein WA817_19005 [Candidatus Acidiferrum sp.]